MIRTKHLVAIFLTSTFADVLITAIVVIQSVDVAFVVDGVAVVDVVAVADVVSVLGSAPNMSMLLVLLLLQVFFEFPLWLFCFLCQVHFFRCWSTYNIGSFSWTGFILKLLMPVPSSHHPLRHYFTASSKRCVDLFQVSLHSYIQASEFTIGLPPPGQTMDVRHSRETCRSCYLALIQDSSCVLY